ncbi:MAG TPA: hypothetical protein VGF99_15335 [Myxococcota bacterium]
MSRLVVVVIVGVVAALSGCDEPCAAAAPPPVSSYERGCVADDDCALASIPDCGPCGGCADTPLRAADVARFDDEQTICCDEPVDEGVNCGACTNLVPICLDGACSALDCDDASDPRCT